MPPRLKSNIYKAIPSSLILILAAIPVPLSGIRILVFEFLAYPFGNELQRLRYLDEPYLTQGGIIVVAVVWATLLYLLILGVGLMWSKLHRGCQTGSRQ